MNKGFEPIYNKDSQILIVGSFPSVKSRKNGFYYGNKQNRFWKMLEYTFDESIGEDVESKINFLNKHHIALYDVVIESDLIGSTDVNLQKSNKKIAKFDFLLPPNSKINKILCNGKTAYNLLVENCNLDIDIIYMQSTSPANPRFKYEDWKNEILKK